MAQFWRLPNGPLGRPWADACGLAVSRGTALARDQAAHYGKPLFIADLVVVAEVGDRLRHG